MKFRGIYIFFISIVSILLLNGIAFSQGLKSKLADEYYASWDYYKAFDLYNDLAKQHQKGKRKNWEEVRKAAYTSLYIRNYAKSLEWFSYLDKNGQLTEEDYLNYIDVLCKNKKYQEAVEKGKEFNQKYPSNYKGILIAQNPDIFNQINSYQIASNISPLNFNSKLGDYCPVFYEDGIVFSSSRKNNAFIQRRFGWDNSYFCDIYLASYKDKNANIFKSPKIFSSAFNSPLHDATITFDEKFSKAIFSRNEIKKKAGKEILVLKLYQSEKDSKGKWTKPAQLNIDSKGYSVSHPCLTADGKMLLFVSDMPGGFGGTDIWYSKWENNSWSTPINAGNIVNTPGDEMFPTLDVENKLFFSSNGHVGLGGLDIFMSDLNFSFVENMGLGINSYADDFHFILNNKTNTGYFTSDREDFVDKIFSSKVEIPQFIADIQLIADNCKNTILPNQTFVLKDKTSNKTIELVTDKNGKVMVTIPHNSTYELVLNQSPWMLKDGVTISTRGKTKSEKITVKAYLYSPNVEVKTTVKDAKSEVPLNNANVRITNLDTQQEVVVKTLSELPNYIQLQKGHTYNIEVFLPGYLKYSKDFELNDKCIDTLNVAVNLDKIKKGDKFVVNNIFYDLGKADLRPESMIELDKLAQFLIENSNIKVELSSHTDSRASDKFNMKLSQKRAESAVKYLISKGVNKNNIIAKGYGETQLVNRCSNGVNCTEEEHQANRRTEIKILEVK